MIIPSIYFILVVLGVFSLILFMGIFIYFYSKHAAYDHDDRYYTQHKWKRIEEGSSVTFKLIKSERIRHDD